MCNLFYFVFKELIGMQEKLPEKKQISDRDNSVSMCS